MAAQRIGFILLGLCASFFVMSSGVGAQSLFPGAASAGPLFSTATAPLFGGGARALSASPRAPLIQQQALSLTDRAGLMARRNGHDPGLPAVPNIYFPPSADALRREVSALWNAPPRDFSRQTDLVCIAVSIYHEARNQPRDGQAAVATVILNRAANPERWGSTPCEVVVPVQFSYLYPNRTFAPIRNLRAWNEAVEIGAQVMLAGPDPRLMGADHYHATYVNPVWNKSMDLVERIADHIFWKSRPKPTG